MTTVFIPIKDEAIHDYLRLLPENVHLVRREPKPETQIEIWTLRSEIFPKEWEGKNVIADTKHGISLFFLPRDSLLMEEV